jgi:hypothetical protein
LRFSGIIKKKEHTAFEEEVKRLKPHFLDFQDDMKQAKVLDIWRRNSCEFPLIYRLARAMTLMPYSSRSLERVFFQCGAIKTIKRNRLSVESLEAVLLIKQAFEDSKVQVTSQMIGHYWESKKSKSVPTHSKDQQPVVEKSNSQSSKIDDITKRLILTLALNSPNQINNESSFLKRPAEISVPPKTKRVERMDIQKE